MTGPTHFLTLSVAVKYEAHRFPRLERPYGPEESKVFLKEMAAKEECYIVVRVSTGNLEVVSDRFLKLTRFTRADCRRAKSWRILQGRGADKAGWEELARKMSKGHAPHFDLIKTSMARERCFMARIYAAPVSIDHRAQSCCMCSLSLNFC